MECVKNETCSVHSLFTDKRTGTKRKRVEKVHVCVYVKRFVRRGDTDLEWPQDQDRANLRPITTYKIVSGGVSTQ